jgi:MFS family permease
MLSASWYKLGSLAALQGAISLTWLIYNAYLAKLLVSYGFPPSWAVALLVIENALATILEPLMGSLSDRAYQWMATKFGFVALGVILASALFILIPTVVVFKDALVAIKWILPGLLIAWAMAMTIFRSPAISLIGRYAMASELPLAMSFLTLAGGIVGSLKPIAQDFLLSLGAPLAFTVGSVVLLAAANVLRYFDPPTMPIAKFPVLQPTPLSYYVSIVGMGLGVAVGSRCVMETLTKVLKVHFPQINFGWGLAVIVLTMAISAMPGGMVAGKLGNRFTILVVGASNDGHICATAGVRFGDRSGNALF